MRGCFLKVHLKPFQTAISLNKMHSEDFENCDCNLYVFVRDFELNLRRSMKFTQRCVSHGVGYSNIRLFSKINVRILPCLNDQFEALAHGQTLGASWSRAPSALALEQNLIESLQSTTILQHSTTHDGSMVLVYMPT